MSEQTIHNERTTMIAKYVVGPLVITLGVLAYPTAAAEWQERDYQDALCADMDTEFPLPDGGGRADCVSETHIIEIDWADNFKYGVGQALSYSTKSGLIPGLILICRRSEALCLRHALNAEETFSAIGIEATVWRCGIDARTLTDCLVVNIAARP